MPILEKTIICPTEATQRKFGGELANACHDRGCIIFLQGNLGAGKTTLARGFLQALGYADKVKSPTYTLIETYSLTQHQVLHIDLYRLNSAEEVDALGINDQLNVNTICLIEWPEHAKERLPAADLTCYIAPFAEGRQLRLAAHTQRGEEILQTMVMT